MYYIAMYPNQNTLAVKKVVAMFCGLGCQQHSCTGIGRPLLISHLVSLQPFQVLAATFLQLGCLLGFHFFFRNKCMFL